MMWVEVLSRHHDVLARTRCDDGARIGRAYDNDVVIDDPYVAPHHLRIVADDAGTLFAEDLGSVNGLYAADADEAQKRIALDGQRVLRVGRTLIRVRAPGFEVAPERPAGRAPRVWPAIAGLAVCVIALAMLTLWLNETREMQPSRFVLPVLAVIFTVLVWTTGWAVLTRIFTGVSEFDRHLLIALGGLLAFYVFDELCDFGSFGFSSRALADYAYVGNWILFAALCFVHLRTMGPRRVPVKAGAVAALALAAIAAQTLSRSDESSMVGQQSYLSDLKPPMFRLKRAQSLDSFFSGTDRLKDGLDRARLEPPSALGWFDNDPDD